MYLKKHFWLYFTLDEKINLGLYNPQWFDVMLIGALWYDDAFQAGENVSYASLV